MLPAPHIMWSSKDIVIFLLLLHVTVPVKSADRLLRNLGHRRSRSGRLSVQHRAPRPLDAALAEELKQLRALLGSQQQASDRQAQLVARLSRELADSVPASSAAAVGDATPSITPTPRAIQARSDATSPAELAAAEAKALSRCEEADVPVLRLLRSLCRNNWHGYGCADKWGLEDRFLPDPARWLLEWNASGACARAPLASTKAARADRGFDSRVRSPCGHQLPARLL